MVEYLKSIFSIKYDIRDNKVSSIGTSDTAFYPIG